MTLPVYSLLSSPDELCVSLNINLPYFCRGHRHEFMGRWPTLLLQIYRVHVDCSALHRTPSFEIKARLSRPPDQNTSTSRMPAPSLRMVL